MFHKSEANSLCFSLLGDAFNYNTQAYSNAFPFQVQAFVINIYVG